MSYVRPGFVTRRILNPMVMRIGAAWALTVPGRKSGQPRTVPVNVLDVGGERYLVAPRGNTDWARNLRAAGEGELRRRGRRERFRASEVPVEQRQPLIDAYLERWGNVTRSLFEQLPDPADHPVFRIEQA